MRLLVLSLKGEFVEVGAWANRLAWQLLSEIIQEYVLPLQFFDDVVLLHLHEKMTILQPW